MTENNDSEMKKSHPMSLKKKWGMLVVMALVFGVIAGGPCMV